MAAARLAPWEASRRDQAESRPSAPELAEQRANQAMAATSARAGRSAEAVDLRLEHAVGMVERLRAQWNRAFAVGAGCASMVSGTNLFGGGRRGK